MHSLNKFSKAITQDPTQPAAQAMLHAIGLDRSDFEKPFVGIASTGYEGNPCNMHLNDLAKLVKKGTLETDVVGLIFNTIGVSDGISMGTPGMRFSLPSRDIIADSMETVVQAMSYDGMITVVGCDKNMPGALMAMIRVNKPSILVYGGTIDSGCHNGKKLDIVSRRLTEKKMSHLKNVFYNDSSEIFDAKDMKEVSLLIAYMCNEKLLNIIREESNFVVSGEKSGEILSVINDSIPQYLSKNIKLINSISKKSESLITKALLGL